MQELKQKFESFLKELPDIYDKDVMDPVMRKYEAIEIIQGVDKWRLEELEDGTFTVNPPHLVKGKSASIVSIISLREDVNQEFCVLVYSSTNNTVKFFSIEFDNENWFRSAIKRQCEQFKSLDGPKEERRLNPFTEKCFFTTMQLTYFNDMDKETIIERNGGVRLDYVGDVWCVEIDELGLASLCKVSELEGKGRPITHFIVQRDDKEIHACTVEFIGESNGPEFFSHEFIPKNRNDMLLQNMLRRYLEYIPKD